MQKLNSPSSLSSASLSSLNHDMFILIFSFMTLKDIHNVMLSGKYMFDLCSEDQVYKIVHDEIIRVHEQYPIKDIFNPETRDMIPYASSLGMSYLVGLKGISNNYRKELVKYLKHQQKQQHYVFTRESEIRNLTLPNMKPNESIQAKFLLIGDGAVGKTIMGKKIAGMDIDEFYPTYFDNYNLKVERGNISLWDSAGQEDYDRLRPLSYPQTDIFLLCYSVVSRGSFMNLKRKFSVEARFHEPNAACVLVGCKIDLRTDEYMIKKLEEKNEKPITYEEGMIMARQLSCLSFFETSSKSGEGLDNIQDFFTKLYYSKVQQWTLKQKSTKKKCFIQ